MNDGGFSASMALLGFESRSTGGGGSAYWRQMLNGDDVYICNEDSKLPTEVGEHVWLSLSTSGGEIVYEQRERTVLQAIAQWARWPDEAPAEDRLVNQEPWREDK